MTTVLCLCDNSVGFVSIEYCVYVNTVLCVCQYTVVFMSVQCFVCVNTVFFLSVVLGLCE